MRILFISWLFIVIHPLSAKDSQKPYQVIFLQADLDNADSAVLQIQHVFGEKSVESPDLYPKNHYGHEHIRMVEDDEIGTAFSFIIHRDLDGDRDKKWSPGKERQRNEIKGYHGSPDSMRGKRMETQHIKWNLKIDKSFQVTKQFCHFFQLKAVGSKNIDKPVLTLSGVNNKGNPQLQLQWWSVQDSGKVFLTDWESSKDQWLQCVCIVHYSRNGFITFSVRSVDGKINQQKELKNLETWRDGFEFVRPKWGIYRSLAKEKEKLNTQDQIRLNNFSIHKF